nr:MAG TPA: hypothetical protein [Caudoviricetes sp.]DAT92948.1 MAG TPA: hypothetical protein [Caudoviricetes sp.]
MCTLFHCTHFDCLSIYLYICYHNAVICAIQYDIHCCISE